MESSNSFREFETFADNLANLGADIIDIYMIYIYMSRAHWLHWVLIHLPAAKALAGKTASATATCDTGCAAAAGGIPCAVARWRQREPRRSNLDRLRAAATFLGVAGC